MSRTIAATIAFLIAASAPVWAQRGGGGVGGGGGAGGGGVKGGGGTSGGATNPTNPGVPGLPNDKFYSKEGSAWVEPYSKAAEMAKADEKFLLVYVYDEKTIANGAVQATEFYLLDVIQLSKTTWVFTKIAYSKDNADLRKLAVKRPGTVLGLDKYGNEWKRIENLSAVDLKALLASVPDQVKKFTDKLAADFARAEALAATDEGRAAKLFADIARIPRVGYKEIEKAGEKLEELVAKLWKAADLAFSVDEAQGVATLKRIAADFKDLPAGAEAEIRTGEVDLKNGAIPPAIQHVKAALRIEGHEGAAAVVAHAKELLTKIVAAGEERIEAAKKTGAADRSKGLSALRQIATEFAGTEAARKAAEAAKAFE